ncbi:MAG: hypothetical protein ACMUJM_15195 [bacterium]
MEQPSVNSPIMVDVELIPIIVNPYRKDIVPGLYIKGGFGGFYRDLDINIDETLIKRKWK